MERIIKEYLDENVKVILKNGQVFTGLFNEVFEEDNEILVGRVCINKNDIEKIEKLKYFQESEILKYLTKDQINFLYNTDININVDIVELIEQLESYLQMYGFENTCVNENGKIVEGIIDILVEIDPEKDMYKYVFVEYDLDNTGNLYCYKSNINGINIGDTVLVDCNGEETYAIVRKIGYYSKDTAPYPVEKTKDIIEVLDL